MMTMMMLPWLAAPLLMVGMFAAARRRRWRHAHGYGHGCGGGYERWHEGFGGHPRGRGPGWGHGPGRGPDAPDGFGREPPPMGPEARGAWGPPGGDVPGGDLLGAALALGRFADRALLAWLYRRLETTHGQEKAIEAALTKLAEAAGRGAETLGHGRVELADALTRPEFDPAFLTEGWVRQDKALEAVRIELSNALAEVHRVLEPEQRRRLAQLLAAGGPAPR
jgi:uncharacterized membrane protein